MRGCAGQRVAYDPDVIDPFFLIDGDLTMYLIPSRAIAGRVGLTLRIYEKYVVGNAAGLLGAGMDAARATAVVSESALGDYAGGVRLSAAACCLLGPLPAGVRGSAGRG
jgi:sirohydrochlorin ferrochelatase